MSWGGGELKKVKIVAPFCSPRIFSISGQKPWTIIRRFGRDRAHSLCSFYSKVESATKMKFAPFCSPGDVLLPAIIFC